MVLFKSEVDSDPLPSLCGGTVAAGVTQFPVKIPRIILGGAFCQLLGIRLHHSHTRWP